MTIIQSLCRKFPCLQISDQTVVCSRHFKKENFKWTPVRKTLHKDVVPSIFNWKQDAVARREIFKHELPEKIPKLEESGHDDEDELNMSVACSPNTLAENADIDRYTYSN